MNLVKTSASMFPLNTILNRIVRAVKKYFRLLLSSENRSLYFLLNAFMSLKFHRSTFGVVDEEILCLMIAFKKKLSFSSTEEAIRERQKTELSCPCEPKKP